MTKILYKKHFFNLRFVVFIDTNDIFTPTIEYSYNELTEFPKAICIILFCVGAGFSWGEEK